MQIFIITWFQFNEGHHQLQTRWMHERHCKSVASTGTISEHEATTYDVQCNSILNESKFFNVVDGMAPDSNAWHSRGCIAIDNNDATEILHM